jgi:glycosyltransferase involved in cell wall biosynthesis
MKVAVVTPTIGSDTLLKCVESVQNQTYGDLTHYIFYDGEEHFQKIQKQVENGDNNHPIKSVKLQENVGKGWYGHRVYSACSFLVNADVICYLDEDNWYDPGHVQKIIDTLNRGYDWVYSLRKIYDKEGNFICEDNCESLGKWPVFFNDSVFHIDTSSFGIRRNNAVRIGHAWYGQWGADRQFFGALKQYYPNFGCTNSFTLNYRLDGNEGSVNREFFEKGNEASKQKYNNVLPWKNNTLANIGPGISLIE